MRKDGRRGGKGGETKINRKEGKRVRVEGGGEKNGRRGRRRESIIYLLVKKN